MKATPFYVEVQLLFSGYLLGEMIGQCADILKGGRPFGVGPNTTDTPVLWNIPIACNRIGGFSHFILVDADGVSAARPRL